MTKKLFFISLFTCLFSICLTVSRNRRDINWNGNNWAMSCDFFNNDFANVQTTAELCGPTCANTSECTHFTWTEWNGGTCWMKQGVITKDDAFSTNDPTMVCGIVIRNETTRIGKRGFGWPFGNNQDLLKNLENGKIAWIYDWSPYRIDLSGAEFVPMIWSSKRGLNANEFFEQVKDAKVVLGFQEPDSVSQSNMSPVEAAQAWQIYLEPLRIRRGIRLGSPAITSTDAGLLWMSQFLEELNKISCHIDFLVLHWYGRSVDNFIDWITLVHTRFGDEYPIWITEFACASFDSNQVISQEEVNEFMQESITKLESLSWIERYAWFGFNDGEVNSANNLFDSNNRLTQLGQSYIHDF